MKQKFKITIIIAIFLLFVLSLFFICRQIGFSKIEAYFSDFLFSEEFSDKKPLSEKNYSLLNTTEKKAYIAILNNVHLHPEYIKIPMLTQEEFTKVYFAVKNDNPDILCFSDSCNMVIFLSSCFLQIEYTYDNLTCDKMTEELNNKVAEITKNITVSDDYSKELYIHDYIIKNCVYDESAANSSNAYGCLITGSAVCSGYSRAAMLLMKVVGVESMLITGTGITSENNSVSHMWNLVWIESEPYHLDVTWDDTDDANGTVSHMFFNLTTSAISTDHKNISTNIECNSENANYFVKEKLIFSTYDREILNNIQYILCDKINNNINYLEFCFDNSDPYLRAVKAIIDNSVPRSDMYSIINYISENATEYVDLTHINFIKDDNKNYIRIMFDSV